MKAGNPRALPQLDGGLFLTDGGIETTLIFNEGIGLPHFAAFHLLKDKAGEAALRRYFRAYGALAKRFGAGLILESATWRASADWGAKLGYDGRDLLEANRRAIWLLEELRDEMKGTRVVISGCVGPRGDGYVADAVMTPREAQIYHARQVDAFASTAADMVTAITMTTTEEAVGIAHAAREAGLPVAISFTVETDGRLPSGEPLGAAIERSDHETSGYVAYYMINCAHPTHFAGALEAKFASRIRGLRANASQKSHAELNESTELDAGNPAELGAQYASLKQRLLPELAVLGGCCGTDHRHVEQMALACQPLFQNGSGFTAK
ncbi:MAG TPA: homocysteine S-methyltransferase family protein [Burkholderiales bacterium]|nr:homocysteine S-methyltransferase family protein [Burkholderiales bacterium]